MDMDFATLIREYRKRMGWTQEELSQQLSYSFETISAWERRRRKPGRPEISRLATFLERDPEELTRLIANSPLQKTTLASYRTKTEAPRECSIEPTLELELGKASDVDPERNIFKSNLVQDAEGNEDMDSNRRKALQGIATIAGTVLAKPQDLLMPLPWADFSKALQERSHFNESKISDIDDATLKLFKDLTETCWRLAKGNELEVVEHILKSYLPKIEALAKRQVSAKQQEAATIASQGYQLESMLAGHQLNFPAREAYGQLAVLYGNESKEANLFVSALTKLGTTFYYKKQSSRSLQVYQEAFRSIDKVSPLLRSRLYVQAATVLAQSGREEEAKNYISLAYENFPAHPQDDPSFLYADYGRPSLSLWAGLTWLELDNPKTAWEAFAQVGGLQPQMIISERNRIEIINHQAEAAVALGDQELFKAYLQEGLKGAKDLKSEKRRRESWDVYEQAKRTWRNDKGITLLRKDLLDIDATTSLA